MKICGENAYVHVHTHYHLHLQRPMTLQTLVATGFRKFSYIYLRHSLCLSLSFLAFPLIFFPIIAQSHTLSRSFQHVVSSVLLCIFPMQSTVLDPELPCTMLANIVMGGGSFPHGSAQIESEKPPCLIISIAMHKRLFSTCRGHLEAHIMIPPRAFQMRPVLHHEFRYR